MMKRRHRLREAEAVLPREHPRRIREARRKERRRARWRKRRRM